MGKLNPTHASKQDRGSYSTGGNRKQTLGAKPEKLFGKLVRWQLDRRAESAQITEWHGSVVPGAHTLHPVSSTSIRNDHETKYWHRKVQKQKSSSKNTAFVIETILLKGNNVHVRRFVLTFHAGNDQAKHNEIDLSLVFQPMGDEPGGKSREPFEQRTTWAIAICGGTNRSRPSDGNQPYP